MGIGTVDSSRGWREHFEVDEGRAVLLCGWIFHDYSVCLYV